jgi:hypothetical protein
MPLPIANASVTELFQVGVESNTAMGAVPATRQMQTWKVDPSPDTAGKEIMQQGAKVDVGWVQGKEWATHKIDGTGSFDEIVYLLNMFLCQPTITPLATPTGTPAQRWVHASKPFQPDTLTRLSGELGNGTRDISFPAMFGQELQIKIDRESLTLGGTLMSQAIVDPFTLTALTATNQVWTWTVTPTPTAGSFTAQLGTFGTAISIPFNATASAIAALLNAYAAPYAGSFSVTGSMPAGPIVITATGFLAQKTMPNFTIVNTGLTGGTVASAITTPGVQVTAGSIIVPFSPALFDFYVDTSFGALGTTKLTDGISATITISNRQMPKWRINSGDNGQLARPVESKLKATIELMAQEDSAAMAMLSAMRANSQQFFRFQAGGPSIDGTNSYLWQLDCAANWTKPKDLKDSDGIFAVTWDGNITANSGWNGWVKSTVINTLAAL